MKYAVLFCCMISFAGMLAAMQQPPPVWIGVAFAVQDGAIRVTGLPYLSPADKAGVLVNDLIVGIDSEKFQVDPTALDREFRSYIARHSPGEALTLKVMRDGDLIDIRVVIEGRPGNLPVKDYSSPKTDWPEESLAARLVEQFKFGKAYEDLRQRL